MQNPIFEHPNAGRKLLVCVVSLRWLAWLAILGCGFVSSRAIALQDTARQKPESFSRPVLIEFHGPIDYALDNYFQSRLSRARGAGADLIILEIDSPGGLKTVSLKIAEQLRDVDWAYTVAWIPREALSGGALVALGCDEIITTPEMRFGDIGAIEFDSEFWAFRMVPAKIQSVLVRQARDLAIARNRPPELAEALIDKDVQVFTRTNEEGELEYRTVRVGEPPPADPWIMIEESGPERFLTVSGTRSREIGLTESIAKDRDEMLSLLKVEPSRLSVQSYTAVDSIVYWLNTFIISALLIIIGLLGLYFELSAPGVGVGGVIAGLCAILFFGSRFLGGTAGWLEVTLFLAGLVMIAMELFVIPGFGVAGIGGLFLLIASAILASQTFVIPQSGREWNQMLNNLVLLLGCGCLFLIGAAWMTRHFGKLPLFGQMILNPEVSGAGMDKPKQPGDKPPMVTHPLVSVGDWGRTESVLRPSGRVRFADRSVDVVSDGRYVEAGTNVKVVAINGNIVTVTPAEEEV